jgi:long-chain acyl-CoA synthetase
MNIISKLQNIWKDINHPFLIHTKGSLKFSDINKQQLIDLSQIKEGDVVALIGDFNPISIYSLLRLIDKKAIIVPLTSETRTQHKYFFDAAFVDVIIEERNITRINHIKKNSLIQTLRDSKHAGLVLFSTGTTGRPKAILHDLTLFLKRFDTPRPTLKTINFLLFDHIGGLNTLLHTLFNKGTVIAPISRSVSDVLETCKKYDVEVLPTTPTFLRMMLMSGLIPGKFPPSIKIITYGTERMDQPTLDALCEHLPNVEIRQTYGMSELGIVRVKSKSNDSLFMKIGGEGVETRIIDKVLEIRSNTKMLGYLNSNNPFSDDGWYNTKDIVEKQNQYYKITGRTSDIINVGGLKFMPSEVERVALQFDGVELAKVEGKENPITGQHVELTIQPINGGNPNIIKLKAFLNLHLPDYMIPKRIKINNVTVGHRFKKL